jgi:hypothetical protein
MARFKVRVKVMAAVEYDIEVDAATENKAEQKATTRQNVRDHLPSDFAVAYGYITDTEIDKTDRLTYVCEHCETEYAADVDPVKQPEALQPWTEDQDFCANCGPLIVAEEEAANARITAIRLARAVHHPSV